MVGVFSEFETNRAWSAKIDHDQGGGSWRLTGDGARRLIRPRCAN
jgi:hypothetical protein